MIFINFFGRIVKIIQKEERALKKLVLKTIGITLAGIIALGVILFGIFALFSPKTIANVADKMGNYSVSVSFYEKNYNKTESLEDLYGLIVKLDAENDGARTAKYCKIMFKPENSGKVAVFMNKKDSELDKSAVKTKEYVYAKYAIGLASQNTLSKTNECMQVCFNYITADGYTINNPLTMLVSGYASKMEKELLQATLTYISQEESKGLYSNLDSSEISRLIKDKNAIKEIIETK